MTELQAGELVFRLGRRAKGFIEWDIGNKTETTGDGSHDEPPPL